MEIPTIYEHLADDFENIGIVLQDTVNHVDDSSDQDTIDKTWAIISSMLSASDMFRNMSEHIKNNLTEYTGNYKIIINNQEESETHITNTHLANNRKTMCGMGYELSSRRSRKVVSTFELNSINYTKNNLCNLCYSVYVTTMDNIVVK